MLHLLASKFLEVICHHIFEERHAPELSLVNVGFDHLLFFFLLLKGDIKLEIGE